MNHDVQIQFPEKSAEQQDIITVTGYEKNAEAAKTEILALVAELVRYCIVFNSSRHLISHFPQIILLLHLRF
jgi:hypothetical protein